MGGKGGGNDAAAHDLIVVGAGSAGFAAAITAAEAGRRVLLIGHGTIGGTCVNTGCVPSKAMIHAAAAVRGAMTADRFPGLSGAAPAVDWAALVAGTARLVAEMRARKYAGLLPRYPTIRYVEAGPARLAEGGVEAGGRFFRGGRIVLATGARPRLPRIDGIGSVPALDPAALLSLPERPRSLLFLGGGFVGAELAQMAARLGVRVTLAMRSRLLPGAEPEAAEVLAGALRDEGIRLEAGLRYLRVEARDGAVRLTAVREGRRLVLTAERLVLTAGRVANTEGLNLARMGVETDPRGAIRVGADMATTRAGIHAAGDVTDRHRFVYMAAHGGRVAASNALGLAALRYDDAAVPWVVFTEPQLAGVGLTEARARALGHAVRTSLLPLSELPRARVARDARGLVKLVCAAGSGRLLGGQILAPQGGEAIQSLALALKAGMTARALGETIFPYLTTAEGLRLAAQGFGRDVTRLSCCAG